MWSDVLLHVKIMILHIEILVSLFVTIWHCQTAFDGTKLVREVGSVLCPFTNFCHVNASKYFAAAKTNITTDTPLRPCCHQCSCTDDCWTLNNCCPDKQPPDSLPDITPCVPSGINPLNSTKEVKDSKYYRVINDCPKDFQNDTVRAKCNGTDRTELKDFVWVSDEDRGTIFQNKHCAICHESFKVNKWELKTTCHDALGLSFVNWKATLLAKEDCDIINIPPRSQMVPEKYECFDHSNNGLYSACNMTGFWKTYDPDIESACLSSSWPYWVPFDYLKKKANNIFCSICNGDPRPAHTICRGSVNEKHHGVSLSVLLDFDALDDTRESYDDRQCTISEVYDNYKRICRVLTCPPGRAPVYGTCTPTSIEIHGLPVQVILQLRVVSLSPASLDYNATNSTQRLGKRTMDYVMNKTGLVIPDCDIRRVQLHSSSQNASGRDLVFLVSLFTTPHCSLDNIISRVTAVIGQEISISFESDSGGLDFVPQFDKRSLSDILDLPKIAQLNHMIQIFSVPYRVERISACPRVVIDYEEAIYLEAKAKEINFEHLANIADKLNETESVQVCIEDYNYVMIEANVGFKIYGYFSVEVIAACLLWFKHILFY